MKLKLSLTLLLLFAATTATAYDFEVDGILYKINGNEVAVTYKGQYHYSVYGYYKGDVVIPDSVTYNGKTYAVTAIGNYAMELCYDLKSIYIPTTVRTIGKNAFNACSKIEEINIPSSVTYIGEYALAHCKGFTSITVDDDNPVYDSRNNCNAINETATNTLLFGCRNTVIPNDITTIGASAFSSREYMNTIHIPNSVTAIGRAAFIYCTNMTNIEFPHSVTCIDDKAFYGCTGLKDLNIPNTVCHIGNQAFYETSGLESITVENGNPFYDSRDNCNAIIETASNTLMLGCVNTVIPTSVTVIGREAFRKCISMVGIDIPNSIVIIASMAFSGCSKLSSVVIPTSVTEIQSYSFANCTALKTIDISNTVTSIGDGAFNGCSGLDTITCRAVTPPSIKRGSFMCNNVDIYSRVTLRVPRGAIEAYKAQEEFGRFASIVAIEGEPESGDVDGDGKLTVSDVTGIIDKVLAGAVSLEDYPAADVNGDGLINIADVTALVDYLLSGTWN